MGRHLPLPGISNISSLLPGLSRQRFELKNKFHSSAQIRPLKGSFAHHAGVKSPLQKSRRDPRRAGNSQTSNNFWFNQHDHFVLRLPFPLPPIILNNYLPHLSLCMPHLPARSLHTALTKAGRAGWGKSFIHMQPVATLNLYWEQGTKSGSKWKDFTLIFERRSWLCKPQHNNRVLTRGERHFPESQLHPGLQAQTDRQREADNIIWEILGCCSLSESVGGFILLWSPLQLFFPHPLGRT